MRYEFVCCNERGVIYKISAPEASLKKYQGLYVYSEFQKENHPLKKLLGDIQFERLQKQFANRGDRMTKVQNIKMKTIPVIVQNEIKDTVTCTNFCDNDNDEIESLIVSGCLLNPDDSFDVETCNKIYKWEKEFDGEFTLKYDIEIDYEPGGKKYLEAAEN